MHGMEQIKSIDLNCILLFAVIVGSFYTRSFELNRGIY